MLKLKELYHRFVFRMLRFFLIPIYDDLSCVQKSIKENSYDLTELTKKLDEGFSATKRELDKLEDRCAEISQRAESIKTDVLTIEKKYTLYKDDLENKIGAMAREIMRTKWRVIDQFDVLNPEEEIECLICGFSAQRREFETINSNCNFAGGYLERYKCPHCGAIFGPSKFRNQDKSRLDDDYTIHYVGFSEADSTEGELETFNMLSPTHTGRYLDYGCGKWANTIKMLREEGYDVYGYDPYAVDVENEYMISDKEKLRKMRFDGIFSHDLLEHLLDPVQEILFMKTLLKSPVCKMAHSTACYEYKFEYTRFHTCFFVDNAVKALCEKSNLIVLDYADDGAYKNFICYVFGLKDDRISFLEEMGSTTNGEDRIIAENEVFYGPYFTLNAGKYRVEIEIETTEGASINMEIVANKNQKLIKREKLKNGLNKIDFFLTEENRDVEFVIHGKDETFVKLKQIAFS